MGYESANLPAPKSDLFFRIVLILISLLVCVLVAPVSSRQAGGYSNIMGWLHAEPQRQEAEAAVLLRPEGIVTTAVGRSDDKNRVEQWEVFKTESVQLEPGRHQVKVATNNLHTVINRGQLLHRRLHCTVDVMIEAGKTYELTWTVDSSRKLTTVSKTQGVYPYSTTRAVLSREPITVNTLHVTLRASEGHEEVGSCYDRGE